MLNQINVHPTSRWTRRLAPGLIALALALLPACSVHVDDSKGEDNVDVKTPFGAVQVHSKADAQDTGLSVYPGARRRESGAHDKHSANVNISSSMFGLNVSAVEYESDDAPEKLIAYYKDDMKKYGRVLECKDYEAQTGWGDKGGSGEIRCDPAPAGSKQLQLQAGNKGNQHIVSIQPFGEGTRFALVRLVTHGGREPI
jgi:hypothetical protein